MPLYAGGRIMAQIVYFGFSIGEVSCPTKYFAEASSIHLRRRITYGLGVVRTSIAYRLDKMGWSHHRIFARDGARLEISPPADTRAVRLAQ